MSNTLLQFLQMGGYGLYVWSAYLSVIICLAGLLIIPYRRWKQYLIKQQLINKIIS
jgi:heme exporter protein CcmD